jgi:5-methyltetrahydrofolate--homocysteine methyltransferase
VRLIGEIDEIWFEAFDALYSIIAKHCEGMSSWMPLYYPGRWYPLQCDFSANMSPTMFDSYVRPSLEREAAFLDRAVYHLDGPDAVKFLDSILDIGRIHGIQWVPGDTGVPESSVAHDKWFPIYEKTRKKEMPGAHGCEAEEIEKILSRISSKGLFLTTVCNSEDEAEELLRLVGKWSRP